MPSPDDDDDDIEDVEVDVETLEFMRPFVSGTLQAGLVLAVATALSGFQSTGIVWNFDWPEAVPAAAVAACCLPALFPMVVCLPQHQPGDVETDMRTLEAGYDQVGTITVVIGEDSPPPQELALRQPFTPGTLSSALHLMKTFWTTPWVASGASFGGVLLGRTAVVVALECLFRGTLLVGLRNALLTDVASAQSGSWLFWFKFFGLTSEENALAAAGLLLVALLTPVALVYARPYQEFARFAATKPVRDRVAAALSAAPVSGPELREAMRGVAADAGASDASLAALMGSARMPLSRGPPRSLLPPRSALPPRSPVGGPRGPAEASSSEHGDAAGASSSTSPSGAPAGQQPSDTSSPQPPGASDETVLSSAALAKVRKAEEASAAAFASLRAAQSASEMEASARALGGASAATRELARSAKAAAALLDKAPDARSAGSTRGAEMLSAAMGGGPVLDNEDVVSEDEFRALLSVETPVDRLVAQLAGTYSVACMVSINAAFVLSHGSLAVSSATAWAVRVLPILVFELSRRQQRDAAAEAARGAGSR
ncbi:hypothetical protein FOA52_006581 [Chlamydomonas sp. UWO 241]|nr:hypothetical protein FOA52_006581 [Chlamydomonas sp. UWO 241]